MLTQAQRIHHYGGPEVIVAEDVMLPQLSAHDVLIEVVAAGVGPWDAWIRSGRSALDQSLPITLGVEISGRVLSAGDAVRHLAPGDEVYGATNAGFTGGYARHAIADGARIARKPAATSFIEAASLPIAAVTAWTMLFERGRLIRRQHVLVHGGAGGVGSLAVQMAHAAGAIVTAVGGPGEATFLRSIGADLAVDYTAGPFEGMTDPVDLVIDTVGDDTQSRSFAVLKPGGMLVSCVSVPNAEKTHRYDVESEFVLVDVTTRVLDLFSSMLQSKTVVPRVGSVLPLRDAKRAHELLDDGSMMNRGKIVLSADETPTY